VFKCTVFEKIITVLVGKNLEEVSNRLNEWRLALGGKGMRISKNKTEYIDSKR